MAASASNQSTANLLEFKRVEYEVIDRAQPHPFNDRWDELKGRLRDCDVQVPSSAAHALVTLKVPMTTWFKNEVDFDKALFEALRKCVIGFCETQEEIKEAIVLRIDEPRKYAIAISRQKAIAEDLCLRAPTEAAASTVSDYTSSGLKAKSTPDHSVCLFRKGGDGTWRVQDCFSVVELKMSDTSCAGFPILDCGAVDEANLKSEHSPLGQVILYALGCTLLCHARRGFLPCKLPLAILAGIRKPKEAAEGAEALLPAARNRLVSDKQRWVSGVLNIPDRCGNHFSYSIKDFGGFEIDPGAENASVEQALSVYVDSIVFGLSSAVKAYNEISRNELSPPLPASGMALRIGKRKLACRFCASPIRGANPIQGIQGESFKISQGELHRGSIFLHGVLWQAKMAKLAHVDFLPNKRLNRKVLPVLVKVSSLTVHPLLVSPSEAMAALQTIRQAEHREDLSKEIGTVLRAVIEMEVGLVSLMVDLSKQGYHPLRPQSFPGKIVVLWNAFTELVQNVLLPLAEINVIHPDIRAGYDETCNIFCKHNKNGTTASMKLVDYESLVLCHKWKSPTYDTRYIKKSPTGTPQRLSGGSA